MTDLMVGYHGDEPYPDDDHDLGEHTETDPDPKCRLCRTWRVALLQERAALRVGETD